MSGERARPAELFGESLADWLSATVGIGNRTPANNDIALPAVSQALAQSLSDSIRPLS